MQIRSVVKVIGLLISNLPGVEYGPLYYRSLEMAKVDSLKAHRGNYDALMKIIPKMKEDLNLWIAKTRHTKRIWRSVYIIGCLKQRLGRHLCGGRWTVMEVSLHINALERTAAFFSLKALTAQEFKVKHITLLIDNRTKLPKQCGFGQEQKEFG